jgi:hypothetical protein
MAELLHVQIKIQMPKTVRMPDVKGILESVKAIGSLVVITARKDKE